MKLYRITAVVSRRKRYEITAHYATPLEARCHWFRVHGVQFVTVEEVKE